MDRPWWMHALQWSLWGVLMALVMGWLERNRLKAEGRRPRGQLYHPFSTLVVGVVAFAFFAGIAIMSNLYPNETVTWLTTTCFILFALSGVPIMLLFFTDKHQVTKDGLSFRTIFGARHMLRWSDVRELRYAPIMKWFRVIPRTGRTAHISAMLVGLPDFARLARRHVPPEAIDPETAEILHQTAANRPPELWEGAN